MYTAGGDTPQWRRLNFKNGSTFLSLFFIIILNECKQKHRFASGIHHRHHHIILCTINVPVLPHKRETCCLRISVIDDYRLRR